MQVKVFEAPDMASGLKMIRRELGPDALILSTKTIKSGKFGTKKRQYLEITAAIDDLPPQQAAPQSSAKKTVSSVTRNTILSYGNYGNNAISDISEISENTIGESNPLSPPLLPEEKGSEQLSMLQEVQNSRDAREENVSSAAPHVTHSDMAHPLPTKRSAERKEDPLREEVNELKKLVTQLTGEISHIRTGEKSHKKTASHPVPSLETRLFSSRRGGSIEEILYTHGINGETSRVLAGFAAEQLSDSELLDTQAIYTFLHSSLETILQIHPLEMKRSSQQKRIALIGPTGVGKTTTLAKLAAKHLAEISHSVALITIDTYRIAAIEQLKVYGEIMHLPVEVVITPQQMAEALAKHSDKDCILIDTAGRSHLDELSIEELQSFLSPNLAIENHLVLSATTRDEEIHLATENFSFLGLQSIIFTKIDECKTLGVLLNAQVKNATPISCLTNGQRVPEDILLIDSASLAQRIIPFHQE